MKSRRTSPPRRGVKRSTCLAIILIDNRPIRHEAMRAYRKLEKDLEKAQRDKLHFEQVDLVAFQRWEAKLFGGLMTEIRETATEYDEIMSLLDDIYCFADRRRCSLAQAYATVMHERSHPHEVTDQDDPWSDDHSQDPPIDWADPEQDFFAKAGIPTPNISLDDFLKMSPKERSRFAQEYEALRQFTMDLIGHYLPTYDQFIERLFALGGQDGQERPSQVQPAKRDPVKRLYRKLVRLLHPDSNQDHGPRELALWHAAQEAYSAQDLFRLEAIAASYELLNASQSDNVPISLIHQAAKELKLTLRSLKQELTHARRHSAWEFTKYPDKQDFLAFKIRSDLKKELANLKSVLKDKEHILKEIQQQPIPTITILKPKKKRAKKKARPQ